MNIYRVASAKGHVAKSGVKVCTVSLVWYFKSVQIDHVVSKFEGKVCSFAKKKFLFYSRVLSVFFLRLEWLQTSVRVDRSVGRYMNDECTISCWVSCYNANIVLRKRWYIIVLVMQGTHIHVPPPWTSGLGPWRNPYFYCP